MTSYTDFDKIKKSYYWQINNEVAEFSMLLEKHFAITYFDYARLYSDNTCIYYANNVNYVDYFLFDANYKPPTTFLKPGKYLWQHYIDETFLSAANQYFNFVNGLTIINAKSDYLEISNFSAPANAADVLDIYLNGSYVLEQFIAAFIEQFDVEKRQQRERILLPPIMTQEKTLLTNNQEKIDAFMIDIKKLYNIRKNAFPAKFGEKTVALSNREIDCLMLLTKGKSNKEIGLELNISFRTVETYFSKLLQKTNLKNRIELITCYQPVSQES